MYNKNIILPVYVNMKLVTLSEARGGKVTTIGLIRHGITKWNSLRKAQGVTDIPLNVIGKKQASDIGDRLSQEEKWDMIITSDLSRAV